MTDAGCDARVLRGRQVRKVTAGQALGQKNTVFAIWMAYTFMTPETAIIGGLCAYPVAIFFMGQSAADIAYYAYIIPFLISTVAGAMISAVLIYSLKKSGVLHTMQESLNR